MPANMTTLQFVTTRCGAANHPEITLQFRDQQPVPVERMLLGYFENGVAAGRRFLPGQTVQLGWATLRLCERSDGTIGVEEREGADWVESCDRSLMQTWVQKEVCQSLGLAEEMSFPRQDQMAIACDEAHLADRWLLTRDQPQDDGDSGWFIGCFKEPAHNHERPEALLAPALIQLVERLPFVTQFLALPPGSQVFVDGTAERIRPRVFMNGQPLQPLAGSYLEALSN